MKRLKVNSLYFYPKDTAQKNAINFLQTKQDINDRMPKIEAEDMSVLHRRVYMAGLFLEMISPELTRFLSTTLDRDRANLKNLHTAIEFLGLADEDATPRNDVETEAVGNTETLEENECDTVTDANGDEDHGHAEESAELKPTTAASNAHKMFSKR